MKRTPIQPLILLILVSIVLLSCSTNQFSIRKNFQPRVKIEATSDPVEVMATKINSSAVRDSAHVKERALIEASVNENIKPTQTIAEKVVRNVFPKKKEILDQMFDQQKRSLRKTQDPNLEGTRVAGLVLGILAMCFAITSGLMIIVMINGGLYVGLVLGLIFAIIAIVLGSVGKFFGFRGLSVGAIVLAALVVLLLFIFLGLILAGLI